MRIRYRIVSAVASLSVIVILLASFDAYRAYQGWSEVRKAGVINLVSEQLLLASGAIAIERGTSVSALGNPSKASDAQLDVILEKRQDSRNHLDIAFEILANNADQFDDIDLTNLNVLLSEIEAMRHNVDMMVAPHYDFDFAILRAGFFFETSLLIDRIHLLRLRAERKLGNSLPPEVAFAFKIRDGLWRESEFLGRERGLLAGIISAQDSFSPSTLDKLGSYRGNYETGRQIVEASQYQLPQSFQETISDIRSYYEGPFNMLRLQVLQAGINRSPYPVSSQDWFRKASDGIELILQAQTQVSIEIMTLIDRSERRALNLFIVDIAVILFATVITWVISGVLLNRVIRPLERIQDALIKLSRGDLSYTIPGLNQPDEIGEMARAVNVFRGFAVNNKQLQIEAQDANEAKSQFLSAMSHELRTPLNSVLGFAQILQGNRHQPLSERQNRHVQQILDSGHHLLDLINQVLDLSKIEAGQLDMSFDAVNVRDIADICLSIATPMAGKRDIIIHDTIPDDLPDIRADVLRTKQALINLLSNAVKYNRPEGTITLGAYLADPATLRITVTDTGPGIPEESQGELFVAFNRIAATPHTVEGTGIGLFLTRKLMTEMGGKVDFTSQEGVGSTFWLEFPIDDSA